MAGWNLSRLVVIVGLLGCNQSKDAAPKLESASAAPDSASKVEAEEEGDPAPGVQALPPEQAFLADAVAPAAPEKPPAKTGVCAFNDNSYDGQDTRSQERMVVKIKDDRIVRVTYFYRGSYALDGTADLNLPVREGKWMPIEVPLSSGSRKFQVKLDRHGMLFKGTAADTPQGDCTWEMAEEK